MFGSSLPPVVCRRTHVLFVLFAHGGVQSRLCCIFVLFFFVLLPVSLTCPICIALLVFSNVFILKKKKIPKTFYFRYSNVRREFDIYFPPSPTGPFPDLTMSSTSGCLIRNMNCLPFGNTFVRLRFLERSVLLLF